MKRAKLNGEPLRIDPDALAGRGLHEIPFSVEKSVGNPRHILVPSKSKPRMNLSFQGDIAVIIYESGTSKVELEDYGFDEFIQVLEGKLILTANGGSPVETEAGGHAVLPKGFSGTWEMVGEPYRELIIGEYKTWLADANAS